MSLNMWQLAPSRLVEVLVDLVPLAKEGAAAYYADVLAAVVDLAVHPPGGPPKNRADFLRRLAPAWLDVAPYRPIPRALPSTKTSTKTSVDATSDLVPKDANPEVPAPLAVVDELELPPTHEPDKPAPAPEQPRPVEPFDDLDEVFGEDGRR